MEQEFHKASPIGDVKDADPMSLFGCSYGRLSLTLIPDGCADRKLPQIYAIASLVLGQPETEAAQVYFSLAIEHIGPLLDTDGLQSIQVLICFAVYSIRSYYGTNFTKVYVLAYT